MLASEMKEKLNETIHPIDEYKKQMCKMLSLSYPTLRKEEIEEAVSYQIKERFRDANCSIYNNYKNITGDMLLSELVQYIESKKPIVTAFGVLFSRHEDQLNPMYDFIDELANIRVKYKDKMFECMEAGDTEGEKRYNLLQLLAKVDMNSSMGPQDREFLCVYL